MIDYARSLLDALLKGSVNARDGLRAHQDLNDLPVRNDQVDHDLANLPTRFDESEFAQLVGNDPGVSQWNVRDPVSTGDYTARGRMGDGMPLVDSGPPADPTNSPGHAQMTARQAALARMPVNTQAFRPNMTLSPGRNSSVDEASGLLAATMRGDTPWATQPNPTMPAYTRGIDTRIPLNPAAVNTQIDDMLARRAAVDKARFGMDYEGRRMPMGQAPGNYETTQRVGTVGHAAAKNPTRYTEEDDGLPGGPNAFGPVLPSRSGLSDSMNKYSEGMKAQRERLAERGESPERIAQLMGGKRPGPDLSVMRAVHDTNLLAGVNPRLSAALALDAAGGASSNGVTNKLLDGIFGVQAVDPLTASKQREADLNNQLLEQKVEDAKNPTLALTRQINAENDQQEAAAQGMLSNQTIDPFQTPAVQTLQSNQYLEGKPLDPRLEQEFIKDFTDDNYDRVLSGWNPLNWAQKWGLGDARSTEDTFVLSVKEKYPNFNEMAARKFYREKILPLQQKERAGWGLSPLTD